MNKTTIWSMLIVAGLTTLVAIILFFARRNHRRDEEIWPFYAKNPLLEKAEQELYRQLIQALPEYVILAQVQLSQLIKVKSGYNFGKWHNRINRMSVDFVICRQDFSPVAAIELDGKSHEHVIQARRDDKKEKALESAGIRLIRWKNYQIPDIATIRTIITKQNEPFNLEAGAKRAERREIFKPWAAALLLPVLASIALFLISTTLVDETVDSISKPPQPQEQSNPPPREQDPTPKQEKKI